MASQDALGRLSLLVIILVVFYDTLFALAKLSIETFNTTLESFAQTLDNIIVLLGGGSSLFPNTVSLLNSILSWEVFLFTNSMALAVIIFIDIIKMSYRG